MYVKQKPEKFLFLTLSYPRRLFVSKNRQVSWLMIIAPYVFPSFDSDHCRLLPITVAGPRWLSTNFPIKLLVYYRHKAPVLPFYFFM